MPRDFFSTSTRVWFDDGNDAHALPLKDSVVTRSFEVRPSLVHSQVNRKPRLRNQRHKVRLTSKFIETAEQLLVERAHRTQRDLDRRLIQALSSVLNDSLDKFNLIIPSNFLQKLHVEELERLEVLDGNLADAMDDARFEDREDRRILLSLNWALKNFDELQETFDDGLLQELLLEAEELIDLERKEDRRYG